MWVKLTPKRRCAGTLMAEQRVRDLVNTPRRSLALRSDVSRWNKVTSALDTIGDTELAITAYLEGRVEAPDYGLLYIAIYGILQILYVQQDALTDLADGLGISLELPAELIEIREVRNSSVGHPTNHRGRFANAINRSAMSLRGFELYIYSHEGSYKKKYIDISALAGEQRKVVAALLESAAHTLEQEEIVHRKQWRERPLLPILEGQTLYALEKLGDGVRSPSVASIGQWGLGHIEAQIAKFKVALEERGLLGSLVGLDVALSETEYPIQWLRQYLLGEHPHASAEDGAVYISYLAGKIEELQDMAKEVDDEYASDDVT
jgi:hypothetical protein